MPFLIDGGQVEAILHTRDKKKKMYQDGENEKGDGMWVRDESEEINFSQSLI